MQFVIFHGSFVTPEKNWEPYLKTELEKLGNQEIETQEAGFTQFPQLLELCKIQIR